jgi:hypothetical protein
VRRIAAGGEEVRNTPKSITKKDMQILVTTSTHYGIEMHRVLWLWLWRGGEKRER